MAAPTLHSDLHRNAARWTDASPDYVGLLATAGGGIATPSPDVSTGLVNLATRSPVVLAFIMDSDPDYIYVGHSPTRFPGDLTDPQPFDNDTVVLVGDQDASIVPIVLPNNAFARLPSNVTCHTAAVIRGPAMHAAATVALRSGAHATGDADTNDLRLRKVMLLPTEIATAAISASPNGRYSLPGFHHNFLAGPMASGVGAAVATFTPLEEWWRGCCTQPAGATTSVLEVTPTAVANPIQVGLVNRWVDQVKRRNLSLLGVGGPQLSTAAFNAGVAAIQTTLTTNANAAITCDRAKSDKTFAQKHGDALGNLLFRCCDVTTDSNLPEVHRLLVAAHKSKEYGIIGALFMERVMVSPVPLGSANVPLATTKLVDDVFRSYLPGGTGLDFGKGLSPFAIVCEGHREMTSVKRAVKNAELVETGGNVSLADAASLTSSDVKFPNEVWIAGEKLYGWSIVVDVFHGVNHPVAQSVRDSVSEIVPQLHRLTSSMSDTPSLGMDLACRVMYGLQQEYFFYLRRLAETATATPPPVITVPDFGVVRRAVATFTAESLSPLPRPWCSLVDAPKTQVENATPRSSVRDVVGAVAAVNPHADSRLVQRFRDSDFATISAMLKDSDAEPPTIGGKPVCLTWALKGTCTTSCKRKDVHIRYSRPIVQKLHELLDKCGVPNPQP